MKGPKEMPEDLDDRIDDILAMIRSGGSHHDLLTPEKEAEKSVSRIWTAVKKRAGENSNIEKMLDAQA
jgi:hypothetical protein